MKRLHFRWRQWLWRWHFYIGLLVCPFLIVLSLSGAVYLFKPQIDAWEANSIHTMAPNRREGEAALSTDVLLSVVKQRYPNARLIRVILPFDADDISVEFDIHLPESAAVEEPLAGGLRIWVDQYTADILAVKARDAQLLSWIKRLHSELLLGNWASYLVELAASWTLILVITGACLWFSRSTSGFSRSTSGFSRSTSGFSKSTSGILQSKGPFRSTPNKRNKTGQRMSVKQRLRQWHGWLGIIVALPLILLVLTGLPWAQLWGGGFKTVKSHFGVSGPGQEWRITLQSSKPSSSGDKMFDEPMIAPETLWKLSETREQSVTIEHLSHQAVTLDTIASMPEWKTLSPPVMIMPPKPNNGVWSLRSLPQQRSERLTVHFDQHTGEELMRIRFNDHPAINRWISHGISLHEGALFGWLNQFLGVLTALLTITLSILGVMAWWKRRPAGKLAALPPVPERLPFLWGVGCIALGIFLPAAGISMLVMFVLQIIWNLKSRIKCRPSWLRFYSGK